jgi:hypothetical protein
VPTRHCASAEYRQVDCWVGSRDVYLEVSRLSDYRSELDMSIVTCQFPSACFFQTTTLPMKFTAFPLGSVMDDVTVSTS